MAEQQGGTPGGRITLDSGRPNWLITGCAIIELNQVGTGEIEKRKEREMGRGSAVGACAVGSGFGIFDEMMMDGISEVSRRG